MSKCILKARVVRASFWGRGVSFPVFGGLEKEE